MAHQQQPIKEQPKPLRKLRTLSGYNLWHSEYFHSAESRTLPTLAAKNKKVAELWREFSTEQKETYNQKASTTSVDSGDNCMTAKNLKGESKKICSYLQDLSDHANMIPGFHLMFVAVYDDKHMVGGTEIGANFLRQLGSHIPYSFLGYISGTMQQQSKSGSCTCSSSISPEVDDINVKDDKGALRRSVEDLFNHRYAQCIGDLSAKLPYKRIADYGIIMSGLPSGKQLKHPSSYGRLTLKEILENKDNIKVEVRNYPQAKINQPQSQDSPIGTTQNLLEPEQPIIHGSKDVNTGTDHSYSQLQPIGKTVQLFVNRKIVGMGTTKAGSRLHCSEIPSNFVIVSIDRIDDNVCPMYTTSFDEPFLSVGQFTAWPIDQLKFI